MRSLLPTLAIILLCGTVFSQNVTPKTSIPQNATLPQQYKNLKADLEIIDGYRMIKMYTMDRFWTIVEDSLRAQKLKNSASMAVIAKQEAKIKSLNSSLLKTENEKQSLTAGVDNMIVFGKTFPKTAVISVSIIIIIGLLVLSGLLFSISRVSFFTSRELRKLNESLYQEFDNYKRNAVEKDIKLSRELQNYRNKFAEAKMA